jgi:hypothetical protein
MKSLLDKKKQITIIRKCPGTCGNEPEEYEIPEISDTSSIIVEHRFNYNGLKIADVAYIDNKDLVCIFEIYNKHATEEINRPESWFEIDAYELINTVNSDSDKISINCIRRSACKDCELVSCLRCNEYKPRWLLNLNPVDNRICKYCYIDYYKAIYLDVKYSDKDVIKSYGGLFDPLYKKWYIDSDNRNSNYILSKWKKWDPKSLTNS